MSHSTPPAYMHGYQQQHPPPAQNIESPPMASLMNPASFGAHHSGSMLAPQPTLDAQHQMRNWINLSDPKVSIGYSRSELGGPAGSQANIQLRVEHALSDQFTIRSDPVNIIYGNQGGPPNQPTFHNEGQNFPLPHHSSQIPYGINPQHQATQNTAGPSRSTHNTENLLEDRPQAPASIKQRAKEARKAREFSPEPELNTHDADQISFIDALMKHIIYVLWLAYHAGSWPTLQGFEFVVSSIFGQYGSTIERYLEQVLRPRVIEWYGGFLSFSRATAAKIWGRTIEARGLDSYPLFIRWYTIKSQITQSFLHRQAADNSHTIHFGHTRLLELFRRQVMYFQKSLPELLRRPQVVFNPTALAFPSAVLGGHILCYISGQYDYKGLMDDPLSEDESIMMAAYRRLIIDILKTNRGPGLVQIMQEQTHHLSSGLEPDPTNKRPPVRYYSMGHTVLGLFALETPPVGTDGYDVRHEPGSHEEPIAEWPSFTRPPPEDPDAIALSQRFLQESERSSVPRLNSTVQQ